MKIIDSPSPNHDARPANQPIDILVLHYTGMLTASGALDWLRNPASKVSAHYFVDEGGKIHRLVDETRRAWHAGVGAWRGHRDINERSIGIEIVNPGHELGYGDFPPQQISAVIALCGKILNQHPIPPRNVVGHSDIAPGRKSDPGERFPWARLAEEGIGLWPAEQPSDPVPIQDVREAIETIGYSVDIASLPEIITAFQRHYQPARVDGLADELTRDRLAALLELVAKTTDTT